MALKLLNRFTLSIVRKTAGTGYLDPTSRKWIQGTDEAAFDISCSVQPFRNGDNQLKLPEGVEANNAIVVLTKTELKTSDELTNQEPDTTTYKGQSYECFNVEDWTGHGLKTDHYRCVFIRKDKS